MKPVMEGISNFSKYSPSALALNLQPPHVTKLKCCDFFIYHGDCDKTVPLSASAKFARAMKKAGIDIELVEYPE